LTVTPLEWGRGEEKLSKILAAFSACLVLAASAGAAQTPRPIDRAIDKVMERGWPGVAVLVEAPDGTVQTAAAGFASLERRMPMMPAAGFHMCSINKTFTAVAVLRLVDDGKLSLDEKVTAILDQPVVKRIPNIEGITVGQLLDHSSGIYPTNNDPTYLKTLIGAEAFSGRVWKPEEMVELATRPREQAESQARRRALLLRYQLHPARYDRRACVARALQGARRTDDPKAARHGRDLLLFGRARRQAHDDGRCERIYQTDDRTDQRSDVQPALPNAAQRLAQHEHRRESIDAAAGLVTTLPDLHKFAAGLFRGKLLSRQSQSFMTAVEGEMAGTEIGKQKTRALQAAATPFGLVLFKAGDGPGGFNTLMAFHPRTGAIFLGFTNQFGDFDEVDVMMTDLMSAAVRELP
jgi:CubicO group peptidase (beta-lactamase class C family)